MTNDDAKTQLDRLYEPDLMVSDSQCESNLVRDAVRQHYAPRDIIEQIYTSELVDCEYENLRLRRYKTLILTATRAPALVNLLGLIMPPGHDLNTLADRYFTNKAERRKIDKLLYRYGLSLATSTPRPYAYRLLRWTRSIAD